MPGDKRLISLGVEDHGVLGIFGVPGVIDLEFRGVFALEVPVKADLWVPVKVVFWVSAGSMFTIFSPYLLIPNPYL